MIGDTFQEIVKSVAKIVPVRVACGRGTMNGAICEENPGRGVSVRAGVGRAENVRKVPERVGPRAGLHRLPAHWRHRLRTTNLREGWFKYLRRYLSRFPGCRNAEHSEQVLAGFLLAAESMHRCGNANEPEHLSTHFQQKCWTVPNRTLLSF